MKPICGFMLMFTMSALGPLRASVQQLPALPQGAVAKALQVDASGNIYVAGSFLPPTPNPSSDTSDAFAAKLTPDGSKVLYFTALGGSGADAAAALALGSDDSVYVTGTTSSSNFPVTAGALQTTYGGQKSQAFAARIDPAGGVAYATYIGGAADTTGVSIAVDGAGDAFVLGTGLPTGVAAIAGGDTATLGGFVVKLNPAGSQLLMGFTGLGGAFLAIDGQGSVYITGQSTPELTAPPYTAGAFQTKQANMGCAGDAFFGIPCQYAYAAKADATGTQLMYLTGLNGTYGASPAGIAVDADGNLLIAGTTYSPDFPVTMGVFESTYAPTIPPIQSEGPSVFLTAPPATGFVTKLNATGAGLVWSTFFGGSSNDTVQAMNIDPEGWIVLAGLAGSADLPGTEDAPAGCRPSAIETISYAARLAPDGTSVSPTELLYGNGTYVFAAAVQSQAAGVASSAAGSVVALTTTGALAAANLFAPARVACVTDPADNVQLLSVVPGQDISIFGDTLAQGLVPEGESSIVASGVVVNFSGTPALLLYVGPDQVNVEVPGAIGADSSVTMEVSNSTTTLPYDQTLTLGVVTLQPSVFLTADGLAGAYAACLPGVAAPEAVALNADGSLNSAANPAAAGSTVTIFLNGVDVSRWASLAVTGMANQAPITFTAGAPNQGVLPVSFQVPSMVLDGLTLSQMQVGGVGVREQFIGVCVTPSVN
jgi:uncharacterized protein (TIGR03437 family)